MTEKLFYTKEVLNEAIELAEQILKNIELSEISLENIAMKTSRLARILNDFDIVDIMKYEVGGYPSSPNGVNHRIFELGRRSGRVYKRKNDDNSITEAIYTESISILENRIRTFEETIKSLPTGNSGDPLVILNKIRTERKGIRNRFTEDSEKLGRRKIVIYNYVSSKYYELKYSGIADDIFSRIRLGVDNKIIEIIPEAVKIFSSIYENLKSENTEDWSNAVHSCRRILQMLADNLYPPCEDITIKDGDKKKQIKLGKDYYINRLIQYISSHSESARYNDLVGSNISYIGDRLDSIFKAAQKGSHSKIQTKEEADRYVLYTYMIVSDILSLNDIKQPLQIEETEEEIKGNKEELEE